MKLSWSKYTLEFRRPAGTSRGVMRSRDVWYIFSDDRIGECAPLPGLSIDDIETIEAKLNQVCKTPELFLDDLSLLNDYPSIKCGLEMLGMDNQAHFDPIAINGLIWMGDSKFMSQQIEQKLREKWSCIKMKIGALDFDAEIEILKKLSRNGVELRVDANGAFDESNVNERLNRLSDLKLHSIEQPIKPGQWDLMEDLCRNSPVPIALDEELIPLQSSEARIQMLDRIKPQYLVLKPSLLGGFAETEAWIKLAEQRGIGWWVTSALESNVGLEAIATWASQLKLTGYQGLGTGQLFKNNIPSPLQLAHGTIQKERCSSWKEVKSFISEWLVPKETIELQTSGSTGTPKKIVVQKKCMKNSARLTGARFGLKSGDSALLCLPMKYIAAKMMVVRALELGLELKVVDPSGTIRESADFVAMVPMQLANSLDQLDHIKTIIVGGSPVNESLIKKLQNTKTEIYETYGMTETVTHVAVKPLNGVHKSECFVALDGVSFETDARGCLIIDAPALNPEPVVTNDVVELLSVTSFNWLGRIDNVINSGGIKMHPEIIEKKLESFLPNRRYFVVGLPDKELGQKLALIVEGDPFDIELNYLPKYEQPKEIIFRSSFPETESGKIKRHALLLSL